MESVQIAFRIDKASRDMARCFNINISDVCRKAIQDEIGLQLQNGFRLEESNKQLVKTRKKTLENYIQLLEYQKEQQEQIMNNITIIKDNLKRQNAVENEKEELYKKINAILDKGYAKKGGISYLKNFLPEYDSNCNYYHSNLKLAKELSRVMGKEIDTVTMFRAIRKYLNLPDPSGRR